jgi:hypothetical protein
MPLWIFSWTFRFILLSFLFKVFLTILLRAELLPNGQMNTEWHSGDVEGNGRGLIWGTITEVDWTGWERPREQVRHSVFRPRFEYGTFRLQFRCDSAGAKLLGVFHFISVTWYLIMYIVHLSTPVNCAWYTFGQIQIRSEKNSGNVNNINGPKMRLRAKYSF